MNYKFRCRVAGINYAQETDLLIELTDEEVKKIRKKVKAFDDLPPYLQIKKHLSKIYKKFLNAALPFINCTEIQNFLKYNYTVAGTDESYKEEALIKEDIEKNGFIPHDQEGHPYIKEELYRQWVKWIEDKLSDKTYEERLKYYEERFDLVYDCSDLFYIVFKFRLPKEFNIPE